MESGLITINEYERNRNRIELLNLEIYSDNFIKTNKHKLSYFLSKWDIDSLQHWSRVYEYPYVLDKIFSYINFKKNYNVLDAGSGITFFPYYLSDRFKNINIECCDSDIKLKKIYNNIGSNKVKFSIQDLVETGYSDNSFDIIYCISVLEHIKNYKKVIKEFKRILKKDGLLILTFDVAIENDKDIPLNKVQNFIDNINKEFGYNIKTDVYKEFVIKDFISTAYIRKQNKNILPWNYKGIKYIKFATAELLKFNIPKLPFYNLAIYTMTIKKK